MLVDRHPLPGNHKILTSPSALFSPFCLIMAYFDLSKVGLFEQPVQS